MSAKRLASIEYKCTYCGKTITKGGTAGRPDPGTCSRKTGNKPHSWVINRKRYYD